MGLESANNFDQLDKTWPLLGDSMRETGGHIRQLKRVVKLMFPGAAGQGFAIPINSTEAEWNRCAGLTAQIQPQLTVIKSNAILVSGFIPYSGLLINIPANYQLCDGTNGTPDLTDRFIMGTTVQAEIGQVGGSADKITPTHSHSMDHIHSVTLTSDGEHDHTVESVSAGSPSGGPGGSSGSGTATVMATRQTTNDGDHAHPVIIDNAVVATTTDGATPIGTNNPKYIKLAFIIRMS